MNLIPTHIVLFPDGNRRWAKKQGVSTKEAHWIGYQNLIKFCTWCKKRGVKTLTAFGFSTENWKRPEEEVKYLFKLFEKGLKLNIENIKKTKKDGIRIRIIGQKDKLPKSLQKTIQAVEKLTKNNSDINLNLAVSYGGRWDILQALKAIMKQRVPVENITEDLVGRHLSTSDLPTPDLIIRAGGEKRLSNFLLWQAAYSELYFSNKLWPDFNEKELDKALKEYSRRRRRFGQ